MHIDPHSYEFVPTNILLSAVSGFLAFIAETDPVLTFGLPVVLFFVGKGVDVFIQLYLKRRK